MKTSLEHLPKEKRVEILQILQIIKQEANPDKVILFGSHASGSWVEDEYIEDGIRFNYISDYDFLVVIEKNGQKEHEIISNIENRCDKYKNSVSPIVHNINYVNEGLKIGQYFFTDIINEGILLFDKGKFSFVKAKELTPQEKKEKAQNYFDMWFPQGSEFLIDANNAFKRDSFRISVFYLHQATECFYNTALLIDTGYKPKTHNLQKLRNYSKHTSLELYRVFGIPKNDEYEYHLFDLLKRGYIDARYKLDYAIEKDELKELIKRVEKMKVIVEKIYTKKVSSFI
ncbi:MAG: HEPN domain-containing protein [Candidatus Cyclobacteriaceae bacterium M2_1C_046]